MLVYLDNQVNEARTPNENYAREVMELHTLGVHGGYSQTDVMELARCFTGWTVGKGVARGKFKFNEDFHDPHPKTVLGTRIEPGGMAEAEQVLDTLATHPATAHFLATKLVRRFIADDPPAELVQRAAQTFLQTQGDIKATLRSILLDGLAVKMTAAPLQPKFKRPVNFVVSALRMVNAETDGGKPVQNYLSQMGQAYYDWPTPDGPPDTTLDWQGNLLQRWKFALALACNELDNGTKVDTDALLALTGATDMETFVERVSPLVLGTPLASGVRAQLSAALRHAGAGDTPETAAAVVAGLIASPAFQWK
jgi:uncharacterized protein (DUF1800 family)